MLTKDKEHTPQKKKGFLMASPSDTGYLENLMKGYSKLRIDDAMRPFSEEDLQTIVDRVDYGILKALDGTWVSYNANSKDWLGSGVHATIMPSPGTNPSTIPGKFVFDSQEYIEKLTFTLVPGGVRNRGGATELFCGALKYEQSIKSVAEESKGGELQYVPIHEENGMYLWLSNLYNYAATKETIERDRGIHAISNADKAKGFNGEYRDEPLVHVKDEKGTDSYILHSQLKEGQKYTEIIPAQEIRPGDGVKGPYFIPDYSISRSGVIPHGSTVTLLGDIIKQDQDTSGLLNIGSPPFPVGIATWKPDHLTISPEMGGTAFDPVNLDQPAPAWVHEKLTDENDPESNKIYSQRILAHDLYPYCVRPDLRLRDTLSKQTVKNNVFIQMFTKKATGAQGGILNVPFVTRFVPTVDASFNLWIETVEEDGKEILQLQYEQIIHFEFHFGNGGGTTSWPHIQVNTLRKLEDIPQDQREVILKQFSENLTIQQKDQKELNKPK